MITTHFAVAREGESIHATAGIPIRTLLMIGELEVGGTQRQMLELAKRLDKSQFSVEVCVLSHSLAFADEFHRAGVQVGILEKRSRYDAGMIPRLRRYFQEQGTDVLITYGFTADAWGRVAACLANVPVVISSVRTSREEGKMLNLVNTLLRPITDHYVANSEAVVDYLRGIGVRPDRISVIPNGIDLARFSAVTETREEIRNSLGVRPSAFVLGIVSRLSAEKNVRGFVRVAQAFVGYCPEAEFVVVGDGPDRSLLEPLAESAGLKERMHWLGTCENIPRVLRAFDIALLTSWREGLSNALLEYMASRLPVVASDVGGNSFVISHGKTGFLFPADDVEQCLKYLISIYDDASLRSRLGSEARREVELRFGMDALVCQTEELILRLLRDRGRLRAALSEWQDKSRAVPGNGD